MTDVELTLTPDSPRARLRHMDLITALDLLAATCTGDYEIHVLLDDLTITARPWKDHTAA